MLSRNGKKASELRATPFSLEIQSCLSTWNRTKVSVVVFFFFLSDLIFFLNSKTDYFQAILYTCIVKANNYISTSDPKGNNPSPESKHAQIKYRRLFFCLQSRACNFQVNCAMWLRFEPVSYWDFITVLVICKFHKDMTETKFAMAWTSSNLGFFSNHEQVTLRLIVRSCQILCKILCLSIPTSFIVVW